MYHTQRSIAAVLYLMGAFGFIFYDMLVRSNWNVLGVLETGATWPIKMLQLL